MTKENEMEGSRTSSAMMRLALVGALTAIVAAACGSSGGAAAPPSKGVPTQVSSVPATVSPSPSATATSPIEGTWHSAHLSEIDVVNAYVAAGGSQNDGRAFFEQLGNVPGKKYAVITLKLLGGTLSEFESGDGSAPLQGYSATYELVGDQDVRVTSSDPSYDCVATYRYQVGANELRLHTLSSVGCGSPSNTKTVDPAGSTLFGSFPFTLAG